MRTAMDRKYFVLVRQAMETASLANDLAMNANYRKDVDDVTRPRLDSLLDAVFHARTLLFHAVSSQMKNDPQERDIPL